MSEPSRSIPPLTPPRYLYHRTCAVCWEAFGFSTFGDRFDRWRHRRKYGHDPADLRPPLSDEEQHARNVRNAARYREYR